MVVASVEATKAATSDVFIARGIMHKQHSITWTGWYCEHLKCARNDGRRVLHLVSKYSHTELDMHRWVAWATAICGSLAHYRCLS